MIRFKNRHNEGFTFVEIILSLFIISLLMGSLMQLSHQTLVSVNEYSGRLQRVYMLKNTLFDITFSLLKEEKFSVDRNATAKSEQLMPTKISYREEEIHEKSALKDFKEGLSRYQIKGEWNSLTGTLKETLTVFIIPPKKDKK
jgi:hypothetical protein